MCVRVCVCVLCVCVCVCVTQQIHTAEKPAFLDVPCFKNSLYFTHIAGDSELL